MENQQRKLEIGCGEKRSHRSDFIGLDRFPFQGVDVTFDLNNGPMPFEENYFDLIYASHSLEHVNDLLAVIKDIWRVSKPGGQLCILAPYYSEPINLANPYHRQSFNEHTPRFWTSAPTSRIDSAEYFYPPASKKWGLAHSDNSVLGFDFRCFRIEFFYFQQYSRLNSSKLRELRRTHNNICHSILYHLVAFKPPMLETDITSMQIEYYIPPEIIQLRAKSKDRENIFKTIRRWIKKRLLGRISGGRRWTN